MKKGQRKRQRKKPEPYFDKSKQRWIARVLMPDGKYRKRTANSKAEAFDLIESMWGDIADGVDGRQTVEVALERWLTVGDWKVKTREDYESVVRKLSNLYATPLEMVTSGHCQQIIDQIPTPAMKKRVRKVMRTAFAWCVRKKMLRVNPVEATESVPYKPAPIEIFDRHEIDLILAAMSPAHQRRCRTLLLLALRPGELWGLHWSDIRSGMIFIRRNVKEVNGKTFVETVKTDAGNRTLPLPDSVAQIFEEERESRDGSKEEMKPIGSRPIFANQRGGYVRHGNWRHKVWKKALTEAGVEYKSPYTLRHTTATWMLNSKASLAAVSKWLGHADKVTTLRHYDHLMVGELEQLRDVADSFDSRPAP